MKGGSKIEKASAALAKMSDRRLRKAKAWEDLVHPFYLGHDDAELLLIRERLKRGLITLRDLTPVQRRKLVDPANLDLHAIAAGPIMDSNEIYLPAGKLSMAETRAREAAAVEQVGRIDS